MFVEILQSINDALWLLCRSGVVEPHQRSAVNAFAKNREVAFDGLCVEGVRGEIQVAWNVWLDAERLEVAGGFGGIEIAVAFEESKRAVSCQLGKFGRSVELVR